MPYTLQVGSQFVCWDSYKVMWYLGPHRLSEIFFSSAFRERSARDEEARRRYPSATKRWESTP